MTQASLNDSVKLVLDLNVSRLDGVVNQALWGDVQVKLKLHHLYPGQILPSNESVVWEALIQGEAINGQISLNLGSETDSDQSQIYASYFINSHRGNTLNDGVLFTAQISTQASDFATFYPLDTQFPFMIPITYIPYSGLSAYSLETGRLLWSEDLPLLQNAYVQLSQSSQMIASLFSQLSFSQGTINGEQLLNFSLLAEDFSDDVILPRHFPLNWRLSANVIQGISTFATASSDLPLEQSNLNELLLDNSISWNKINWQGYVFGENGDVFQLQDQMIYDFYISFRDANYSGLSFDRLDVLSFPNVLQRFTSSNVIYSESDSINLSKENVFSGLASIFTNKLAFTRFNFNALASNQSPIDFSLLLFDGSIISANNLDFSKLSQNSVPFNKILINEHAILSDYFSNKLISSNHLTDGSINSKHLDSYVVDSSHVMSQSVFEQHLYPNSLFAYNLSSAIYVQSPLFLDYDFNRSLSFINIRFMSDAGIFEHIQDNQSYLKLDPVYIKQLYFPEYQTFSSGNIPLKSPGQFQASSLIFNENHSSIGLGLVNTDFVFNVLGDVKITNDITTDTLLIENSTNISLNNLSVGQLNTSYLLNNDIFSENIHILSDIDFDDYLFVSNNVNVLGAVTLFGLELPNQQLQTSEFFASNIFSYQESDITIASNIDLQNAMYISQNLFASNQLQVSQIILPSNNSHFSFHLSPSIFNELRLSQDGTVEIVSDEQSIADQIDQPFSLIVDDALFTNHFYTSDHLFVNQLEIDQDMFVDAYLNVPTTLLNTFSPYNAQEALTLAGFMKGVQSDESHQLNSLYARAWGVSHFIDEGTDYATAWGNGMTLSSELSASAMTAWGNNNFAQARSVTVWGNDNQANDEGATSWGKNTSVNSQFSTAFGNETMVIDNYSTVWGNQTNASYLSSTAWGNQTKANVHYATVWGNQNSIASPFPSMIYFSTSWGNFNRSEAFSSTAFGDHTNANSNFLTVMGKYNATLQSYVPTQLLVGGGIFENPLNILEVISPSTININGNLFVQNTIQAVSFDQADQVSMPILKTDAIIPFSETNQTLDLSAFSAVFLQSGSHADYAFGLANSQAANSNFSVTWGDNTQANQMLTSVWGKNTQANHLNATVMGLNSRSLTNNSLSIGSYYPSEASLNHRFPLFVIGGGKPDEPRFLWEVYPSKNSSIPAAAVFHSNLLLSNHLSSNAVFTASFANETISMNVIQNMSPEASLDMSAIQSLKFSDFTNDNASHFFLEGSNLQISGKGLTAFGINNRFISELDDSNFHTFWGEDNFTQVIGVPYASNANFLFGGSNEVYSNASNVTSYATLWGKRTKLNHESDRPTLGMGSNYATAWASARTNTPYSTAFGAKATFTMDGLESLVYHRADIFEYGENASALGQAHSHWPNSFVLGKGNSLAPVYSYSTSPSYTDTYYMLKGFDEIPLGVRYPLFIVGKGGVMPSDIGEAINVLEVFNSYVGAYDTDDQNQTVAIPLGPIANTNASVFISGNVQAENLSLISSDLNNVSTVSSPTVNTNMLSVLNDQQNNHLNLTDFSLMVFGGDVTTSTSSTTATVRGNNTQVSTDSFSKASAWGDGARAIASLSTAWGKDTQALSQGIDIGTSVSWGNGTITNQSSTGFGSNNMVTNKGTTFGEENQVLNSYSSSATAFGKGLLVNGAPYSTTLGLNNYNIWPSSLLVGSYNATDNLVHSSSPLFIIGGGTGDHNRFNVLEVYHHSDPYYAGLNISGDLYVTGSMGIDFNDYQFYEGNYLLTHKLVPFTPVITTFNLLPFAGFVIGNDTFVQDEKIVSTWGDDHVISRNLSTVWGKQNKSYNDLQSIWGHNNVSSMENATVFGYDNLVQSAFSFAGTLWGRNSELSQSSLTTAWGNEVRALGFGDTVWGQSSVADNFFTQTFNTAFGLNTKTSGVFSTVMGTGIVLNSNIMNTFATGRYTKQVNGNELFIIGSGTATDKKNIVSIFQIPESSTTRIVAELKVFPFLNFSFGQSVFAPLYDKNSFLQDTDSWGNTVFGEDSYIGFDLDYFREGFTGGNEFFFISIYNNNSATTFYPKNASAWGKNIFVIGDLVTAFGESVYPSNYPNLNYEDKQSIFRSAYGGRGLTVFGYNHMDKTSSNKNNENNVIEQYNVMFGAENQLWPSHFSTVWGHENVLAFNTNDRNVSSIDIEDHANQQSYQTLFGRANEAASFLGTGWGLDNQIGLFVVSSSVYTFDRYNTAWGKGVQSYADFSTAWGISTNAGLRIETRPRQIKYPYSTAWGQETQTASDNATVWGLNNISVGTVWGVSNNSSDVNADTTVWGSFNSPVSNQASSAITMWGVSNNAFLNAVAFGKQSTANAVFSLGFGNHNHAVSSFSLAFGDNTIASSNYSVAFGKNTSSNAENSLVAGDQNFSSGAMVFGNQNQHSGTSLALGSMNFANRLSTVFGHQNQIDSYASLLAGEWNQLNSESSAVFGSHNVLNGDNSSLFGRNSSMNMSYSALFGQDHYTLRNQSYSAFFGSGIKKDDDKSLWLINLLQDDSISLPTYMYYQAIFGRSNFFLALYASLFGQSHGFFPLYNNTPTPNLSQISPMLVSALGYGHILNGDYGTYFGSEHNTHEFYYFTQQDNAIESSDVTDNFALSIDPQYSTYFGQKNTTYGNFSTVFGSLNSALGEHDSVFGTHHYADLRNFNTITNQSSTFGSQIIDFYPSDSPIYKYPKSYDLTVDQLTSQSSYSSIFGSANAILSNSEPSNSEPYQLATIFGNSNFLQRNNDGDAYGSLFGSKHVASGKGGTHFGSYDVFYNGQTTDFNLFPFSFFEETEFSMPYWWESSFGTYEPASNLYLKNADWSTSMGYNLTVPPEWENAFVIGQSNTIHVLNPENTSMQGNPLFLIGNGSSLFDTESTEDRVIAEVYRYNPTFIPPITDTTISQLGAPYEFSLGSTFTVYESGTVLIANLNHFTTSQHFLDDDGTIDSAYVNGLMTVEDPLDPSSFYFSIPPKGVTLNVSGTLHIYNLTHILGIDHDWNPLIQETRRLEPLSFWEQPWEHLETLPMANSSDYYIVDTLSNSLPVPSDLYKPLVFEHHGIFALDLPEFHNGRVWSYDWWSYDIYIYFAAFLDTGVWYSERPYQFSQFNITEDDTYTIFGKSSYEWLPIGSFTKDIYYFYDALSSAANIFPDDVNMHLRILNPFILDSSIPDMGWSMDQYDDFRVVGYGIGHTSFGEDTYGRGAYSTSFGESRPVGFPKDSYNNWVYTPPKLLYDYDIYNPYNIVNYTGFKNEYLGANGDFSFTKGFNLVAFSQSATLFGYYNEVKNEWAQNITVFGENNVIPTLNSEVDSYQAGFNSYNTIGLNATIFGKNFVYRDQEKDSYGYIYGNNIKYGDLNRSYESVYRDYNSLGSNVTLFGQGVNSSTFGDVSNTRFDFFKDLLTHFGKENGNYGFNNTLFGYANQAGDYYYLSTHPQIHPSYATTTFGSNNYIFSSKVLTERTGNSGYDDVSNAYHTIFGKHNIINFPYSPAIDGFFSETMSKENVFEFGGTNHNYNNSRGGGSNHTIFGQRNAINDFSEFISHTVWLNWKFFLRYHHQVDSRTVMGQSIFALSFSDKVSHGLIAGRGSTFIDYWDLISNNFLGLKQVLIDRNNETVLSHGLSSMNFNYSGDLNNNKHLLFNHNHLFSFNGSRVQNYQTTVDDLKFDIFFAVIPGFSNYVYLRDIDNLDNVFDLGWFLRNIYPIEDFDSSTIFDLDLLFNGPLFSLQDISGVSHEDPKSLYAAFYKSRADLYRGFLCVKQTDDNSNPMARMFLNMTSTLGSSSDFEYIHFSHYLYRESNQDFYSIFFSQQQPNENIVKTELLTIGESLFTYRDVSFSSSIAMPNNNDINLPTMYKGAPLFQVSGSDDSYAFINTQLYVLSDAKPNSFTEDQYALIVRGSLSASGRNNSSDRRLKRDIVSIKANIGDMMQLNPVTFIFNNDQTNRTNYGFIAQDILPYFPDLVAQSPDDSYALHYDGFYTLAVSVIQQQQQVLNQQKETLQALNQELIELKQTFDTRLASLQP